MRLPVAVKLAFNPYLLNTKALQKLVEKLHVERLVQVGRQPVFLPANIKCKRLAEILPFRTKVQLQLVLSGLGGGDGEGGNPLLEDMFLAELSAREECMGRSIKVDPGVIVVEEDLIDGINSTSVAEIVDEGILKIYGRRLDSISWRL